MTALTLLLAHWRAVAVAVLVAAVLIGVPIAKGRYDEARREEGRQEVRTAELVEAQRVAGEFAKSVATTERDLLMRMEKRNAAFARISGVALRLPAPIRAGVVPAAVVGLLDLAIGEANGTAGSAGGTDGPTPAATGDSTLGDQTDWTIEVIRVCKTYRDRAEAWAAWYGNLQDIVGHTP
jgi:hypothetical protein